MNKETKLKMYLEIGDPILVTNLRYPKKAQTSGTWLIHEVKNTKKTIELHVVLHKKGGFWN